MFNTGAKAENYAEIQVSNEGDIKIKKYFLSNKNLGIYIGFPQGGLQKSRHRNSIHVLKLDYTFHHNVA